MSLEYNLAYHLRCEITQRSGRKLWLQSLRQDMTYAGWMEGVPSSRWNDGIIESRLKDAAVGLQAGAKPVLIAPERRDYLRNPGDMAGVRTFRGQAPEWLPRVACVAGLWSSGRVRDPNADGSMLVVVWFQDEYAMPIAEPVLQQIRSIDWEQRATDFES